MIVVWIMTAAVGVLLVLIPVVEDSQDKNAGIMALGGFLMGLAITQIQFISP